MPWLTDAVVGRFSRIYSGLQSHPAGAARNDVEADLHRWMIAALDGDGAAYRRLLAAMSGYLQLYYALRLGTASAEVEELVRETLLAIHLRRATYDPTRLFTAWAHAIAHYKLNDHLRRKRWPARVAVESAGALFGSDDTRPGTARIELDRSSGERPTFGLCQTTP